MNKTKETYIAALYGVTPEQQRELRYAIARTWSQICYDVNISDDPEYGTEDQQMIELVCDANRLEIIGNIGDWFSDIKDQMLLAFDAYGVYPEEWWKSYAEKNNIEMWMLR